MNNVNGRLMAALNSGLGEKSAQDVEDFICNIVGTEHYNDNLRELRGTFGFALPSGLAGASPTTLPPIGTTARAFETTIANGGANDPNQANLVPLNSGAANFDSGKVDGEELIILFGMGVEISFPLAPAVAPGILSFPAIEYPRPHAMQRLGRAVTLSMFSNSRALALGTVADWPTVKGNAAALRNGYTCNGSRSFRPIALKPSTRFHVEGEVVDAVELAEASAGVDLQLVSFTVSFRAWRINIRETFGGAQCANLFR